MAEELTVAAVTESPSRSGWRMRCRSYAPSCCPLLASPSSASHGWGSWHVRATVGKLVPLAPRVPAELGEKTGSKVRKGRESTARRALGSSPPTIFTCLSLHKDQGRQDRTQPLVRTRQTLSLFLRDPHNGTVLEKLPSFLPTSTMSFTSITHYTVTICSPICLPEQSMDSLKIWTMPLLFLGPSVYHHKPIHSKCSGSRCLNRLVG